MQPTSRSAVRPSRWPRAFAGVSPMTGLTHVVVRGSGTPSPGSCTPPNRPAAPWPAARLRRAPRGRTVGDLGAQPGDADVKGGLEIADVAGVEATPTPRPWTPQPASRRRRWGPRRVDGPSDLALAPLHRASRLPLISARHCSMSVEVTACAPETALPGDLGHHRRQRALLSLLAVAGSTPRRHANAATPPTTSTGSGAAAGCR